MANRFGLTLKFICSLQKKELLTQFLDTDADRFILEFLGLIKRDKSVLRQLLAFQTKADRLKLAQTAGMNRMESYIYTRFTNLKETDKLPIYQLVNDLTGMFNILESKALLATIRRIRQRVYNERYRRSLKSGDFLGSDENQ